MIIPATRPLPFDSPLFLFCYKTIKIPNCFELQNNVNDDDRIELELLLFSMDDFERSFGVQ
jgi:hypothetical protein